MVQSITAPSIAAELPPLRDVVVTKMAQGALNAGTLGDAGMRNVARPKRCAQEALRK